MDQSQIEDWFREGIRSAKHGDAVRARVCLRKIVETDKENIQAWLWLSSVVETDDERRLCLQNVLVLDPNHAAARRGLIRLGQGEPDYQIASTRNLHQQTNSAPTVASSVLYPKRLHPEGALENSIRPTFEKQISYKSVSAYSDIWETDIPICAYCASRISPDARRCTGCGRRLTVSGYRYEFAGTELFVYGTFIVSLAMFSFISLSFSLLLGQPLTDSIWNGVLVVVAGFLFIGVLMRQFWAFATSIVILLLTIVFIVLSFGDQPTVAEITGSLDADNLARTLLDRPYVYVLVPLQQFLMPLQLLLAGFGLIFCLLKVGPNFERVHGRLEARVDKGLNDSSQFFAVGKNYAERRMWATAVLHFRRAAALQPGQPAYLYHLGQSYYQTGYYQRSLDVLESAKSISFDPSTKQRIDSLIKKSQEKLQV